MEHSEVGTMEHIEVINLLTNKEETVRDDVDLEALKFPSSPSPFDRVSLTMTKSPQLQRSFVKEKTLLGITPVTHDYYNQWARSPKIIDSSSSDPGQGTPEREHVIPEPRAKTSLPRAARMTSSRADLKTANHKPAFCRSTTPSVNVELPPMTSLRRSVTVVGGERVDRSTPFCVERSQSAFLPKRVVPSYQALPMNQAVFLFKGDTFIQNAPFLGDPNRGSRSVSRYSMCGGQRLPSTKTHNKVTMKGETTTRPNVPGPVQVAKVQFIDFSDVKSYVSIKREVSKPKKAKEKQFLPLNIPLGISI